MSAILLETIDLAVQPEVITLPVGRTIHSTKLIAELEKRGVSLLRFSEPTE